MKGTYGTQAMLVVCTALLFAACGGGKSGEPGEVAVTEVSGSDLPRAFDVGLPDTPRMTGKDVSADTAREIDLSSNDMADAAEVCIPDCEGMECGDDGCGGSCGDCDDEDVCNGVEQCDSGQCVSGAPLSCDDDGPCTVDECDPVLGCQHTEHDGPCDDGDPCTKLDVCLAGVCAGNPVLCGDEDPCTVDTCDPSTGSCNSVLSLALPECTITACWGHTESEANKVCDDDSLCTLDTCAYPNGFSSVPPGYAPAIKDLTDLPVGVGLCEHQQFDPATDCDDGNPCTADTCVDSLGCVNACEKNSPVQDCPPCWWYDCDDGDPCTEPFWSGGSSYCEFSPVQCKDMNLCTNDYCDPTVAEGVDPCVFEPIDGCGP